MLWAGGWRTGVDMAHGMQRYVGEGGAVAAEFDKVVRCDAVTNFAVMDLAKAPSPPDSGPVSFSNCTVKEGRTFPDALGAVNAWIAYGKEHGIESDNYLLFPAMGEQRSAKYSFKWVTTSSWEAFGKSYDQYGTAGGWQKAQELFGGLLDCDSSRVYVSQRVRRLAPASPSSAISTPSAGSSNTSACARPSWTGLRQPARFTRSFASPSRGRVGGCRPAGTEPVATRRSTAVGRLCLQRRVGSRLGLRGRATPASAISAGRAAVASTHRPIKPPSSSARSRLASRASKRLSIQNAYR